MSGNVYGKNDDHWERARRAVDRVVASCADRLRNGGMIRIGWGDTGPDAAINDAELRVAELQPAIVVELVRHLREYDAALAAMRSGMTEFQSWNPHHFPGWNEQAIPRSILVDLLRKTLSRKVELSEANVVALVDWSLQGAHELGNWAYPMAGIVATIERLAKESGINDALRAVLQRFLARLSEYPDQADCRKAGEKIETLLSGSTKVFLKPGEAWSDVAIGDLKSLLVDDATKWFELLAACQAAGKGKPGKRWRIEFQPLVGAVGRANFQSAILRWFPLVDKPRTQTRARRNEWDPQFDQLIIPQHVELLRGLVWCCALEEDLEIARALGRLAMSAYRKIPGKGPRLVSLGNACVTALGAMPGRAAIGQLALLRVKVKFGSAQKEIDKAFRAAAEREGLPTEEIEEMGVPSYGLEDVGTLVLPFGEYRAELQVNGSNARICWHKGEKGIKSVPAAVRQEHAEEFRELQASLKDVNAMLPAQRERLDGLFLRQARWPFATWRERYLDHPLVGTIARRLIWTFEKGGAVVHAAWSDGALRDLEDVATPLADDAIVTLWHPIGHAIEDVLRWREWLERHEIVQPFKQAHREVYLLTDAERRTNVYSNRFAAHVLRQHQFHALCAARHWKNQLRLMVDADYAPAHRILPGWGLRAEFWIEGAGDNYGVDTNEAGAFLYLTTDQVRFYQIATAQRRAHASGGGYAPGWNQEDAEPVTLEAVPPLVFSEIMRDVDLFVGVASVGNNPEWSDGGPDGRYATYWNNYSFGELSATAQTRKEILEKLVPRLKIADRCTIADRFLCVRGDLREYRIHLGSGNILMSPNDQYLCIVPKQTTAAAGERVFLPFEGDNLLSVILAKAFLLATDTKITDKTITSQIGRS